MPKLSAGLLIYRSEGELQVLLVHPGGPLWAKKDAGAWSIPKGEYLKGEDALLSAKREFREETGNVLQEEEFIPLEAVKLKSGKIISAWAVKTNNDITFIKSNAFEMEWPPRSGKKQSFFEVDKVEWFTIEEAKIKINTGQIDFLEQLSEIVK